MKVVSPIQALSEKVRSRVIRATYALVTRNIRGHVVIAIYSESEHVIQRKSAGFIHQAVISEQPACGITDQDIAIRSSSRQRRRIKCRVRPDHDGAATGDGGRC